ncbi:MAG: hypothetical protein DCF21_15025 [Leptolyngbya sp.]|jgi:hypothetical protein|uniref:Uncharacterized protein n=1 Tax=Shackletoniella antarctica TaxID=268115 RepID=A0A2W4XYV1_9CYAN|nr:MAG: hypothetical protein DCF17_11790 [Shackletoniella antarctica]PZV12795.1 MAG: hypothetical protein DCF21_15025 [Leptolyngbya sp.]
MNPNSQALPDYERHLLGAMAYFLGRDPEAQARACLCMYLRQAEPRIMAQVRYYAHRLSAQTGQPVSEYDLLTLIAQSPEAVTELLPDLGQVHNPNQPDVFS